MSDKKNKGIDVEALLSVNIPTNSVIAEALKDYQAEQAQATKKRVIENLKTIQDRLAYEVEKLRAARRIEANAKQRVVKVAELQEKFMQDADFDAFAKAYNNLD